MHSLKLPKVDMPLIRSVVTSEYISPNEWVDDIKKDKTINLIDEL